MSSVTPVIWAGVAVAGQEASQVSGTCTLIPQQRPVHCGLDYLTVQQTLTKAAA